MLLAQVQDAVALSRCGKGVAMGFFRRCKGLEQRRGSPPLACWFCFFSPKQFVIQHFSDPSEDIFMECLVMLMRGYAAVNVALRL